MATDGAVSAGRVLSLRRHRNFVSLKHRVGIQKRRRRRPLFFRDPLDEGGASPSHPLPGPALLLWTKLAVSSLWSSLLFCQSRAGALFCVCRLPPAADVEGESCCAAKTRKGGGTFSQESLPASRPMKATAREKAQLQRSVSPGETQAAAPSPEHSHETQPSAAAIGEAPPSPSAAARVASSVSRDSQEGGVWSLRRSKTDLSLESSSRLRERRRPSPPAASGSPRTPSDGLAAEFERQLLLQSEGAGVSNGVLVGALASLLREGGNPSGAARLTVEAGRRSEEKALLLTEAEMHTSDDNPSAATCWGGGRAVFYGLLFVLLLLLAGALALGCALHKQKLVRLRPRELQRLQLETLDDLLSQLLAHHKQQPTPPAVFAPRRALPNAAAASVGQGKAFLFGDAASSGGAAAALSAEASLVYERIRSETGEKRAPSEKEFENSETTQDASEGLLSAPAKSAAGTGGFFSLPSSLAASPPPVPRGVSVFAKAADAASLHSFFGNPKSELRVCAEPSVSKLLDSRAQEAAAASRLAAREGFFGLAVEEGLKAMAFGFLSLLALLLRAVGRARAAAAGALSSLASSVSGLIEDERKGGLAGAAPLPSSCTALGGGAVDLSRCAFCSCVSPVEDAEADWGVFRQSCAKERRGFCTAAEGVVCEAPPASELERFCCEASLELRLVEEQLPPTQPRGAVEEERLVTYAAALRAFTSGLLPAVFLCKWRSQSLSQGKCDDDSGFPEEARSAAPFAAAAASWSLHSLPGELAFDFSNWISPCYPFARFLHARLLGLGGLELHLILAGGWLHSVLSAAPVTLVHVPRAAFVAALSLYRGLLLFVGLNVVQSKVLELLRPAEEGAEWTLRGWEDFDLSDHVVLYVLVVIVASIETAAAINGWRRSFGGEEALPAGAASRRPRRGAGLFRTSLSAAPAVAVSAYYAVVCGCCFFMAFYTALFFHTPLEVWGAFAVGLLFLLAPTLLILEGLQTPSLRRLGLLSTAAPQRKAASNARAPPAVSAEETRRSRPDGEPS